MNKANLKSKNLIVIVLAIGLISALSLPASSAEKILDKSYQDNELSFYINETRGKRYSSGKAIGCLKKIGEKNPKKCHVSEQLEAWISCLPSAQDGSMISQVEVYMKGWTETFVFDGRTFDGFLSEISFSIATDFCDKTIEDDEECDGC